jgi:hypothetical protein
MHSNRPTARPFVLALVAVLQGCPLPIPGSTSHSPYIVGSFETDFEALAGAKIRVIGNVDAGICEGEFASEAEIAEDGSFKICPAVQKRKYVVILPGAAHMITTWNLCIHHEGQWHPVDASSFYAPMPNGAFGIGEYRCEIDDDDIVCEMYHDRFPSEIQVASLPGRSDCAEQRLPAPGVLP